MAATTIGGDRRRVTQIRVRVGHVDRCRTATRCGMKLSSARRNGLTDEFRGGVDAPKDVVRTMLVPAIVVAAHLSGALPNDSLRFDPNDPQWTTLEQQTEAPSRV